MSTDHALHRYVEYLGSSGHPMSVCFAGARAHTLGQGYNNQVFTLETGTGVYVLKIYHPTRQDHMIREWNALCLLQPSDVAPVPLLNEPHAPFIEAPALIYHKIIGQPLHDITLTDLLKLEKIWRVIHHIAIPPQSLLNARVGPTCPQDSLALIDQMIESLRHKAYGESRMNDALKRLYRLRVEFTTARLREDLWNRASLRFCQADTRPGNIVREDTGALRIVDWEHAGLMDPCYDIASFFTHPESLSIPHADRMRVFEACCSASDDRTFFDRISVYMTLLPAQWIAKILSLIAHYDRQIVQEGVRPRPKQALWEDLERYFEMAENRRAKGLL